MQQGHSKLFNLFVSHVRNECSSLIHKMQSDAIDIGSLTGEKFFKVNPKLHTLPKNLEMQAIADLFSPFNLHEGKHLVTRGKLSKREKQCLYLYLQGHTAEKTARTLRLSKRTVEHYMDSVRVKLNCEKKADLPNIIGSLQN